MELRHGRRSAFRMPGQQNLRIFLLLNLGFASDQTRYFVSGDIRHDPTYSCFDFGVWFRWLPHGTWVWILRRRRVEPRFDDSFDPSSSQGYLVPSSASPK